ncbi:MAG: hypothetical protein JO341_05740 [Gammaproteobacteria bacterium]|nr:hypothetical protein [Gammaproteobacteria bacterium]MBV9620507.1 hypothetical protein [Gammaproteobacteria bacterium]
MRLASLFARRDGAPRVVRASAPALRWTLYVGSVLTGVFALYVCYELGRYDAGYDRQAVAQQRSELEVQIEHLERANRELRTQLAELDTVRIGRTREQAEVARSMGELQAQIDRQTQELAFYRGVVAQSASAIGLKIEQLRVNPGPRPGSFLLHLSLVRAGRADTGAVGTLLISVEGTQGGAPKILDLAALSAGRLHELRYDFRYLQVFDQALTLPPAFHPERLALEVHSAHKDVAPLTQTFLWSVEPAP